MRIPFFKTKKKGSAMSSACPICDDGEGIPFATVDGYPYFECSRCNSIFIDPKVLELIDRGEFVRTYDQSYWAAEDESARERSFGAALARVAELFLYARKPITRFIDIASGPGYLLDALSIYLPSSKNLFWGIERFPPPTYTNHPNYRIGLLEDMEDTFDAGTCIEVFEHLTPNMLRDLAVSMARKSRPDSIFLINTGMPPHVRNGNLSYLDPLVRGHIVSYSLKGIECIFKPLGFEVIPLPGKDWAFLLEYLPTKQGAGTAIDRIWTPDPHNRQLLHDREMGNVLYCLGVDTARAYV